MQHPIVTVAIPAQNEAADIERSLSAVLAQDYPHDCLQVLVVDGGSSDDTVAIARSLLAGNGLADAQVLSNDGGSTPGNLNTALRAASGSILCRVDARSIIPADYVRRCAELLDAHPERVVVGGAQVALARDTTSTALGIARALNNRWGMGLARYRRGAGSGPTDTVYLGAFRTEELRAAGGWDEAFPTNQDFELNRRMGQRGEVWFDSALQVGYLPRARVADLFSQYRRFGAWKVRYWRTTGDPPRPRQLLLLGVGPAVLAGSVLWWRLPWRARLGALGVAAAGSLAVEARGADEPTGDIGAHLVSVGAMAAVAAGWSVGAWSALLRRS